MAADVKGLAIITAAVALALTPGAAAAKKPEKAKDRGAKVERTSAQRLCRAERKELGAAAFAAKYGKARTKGSARAKAKAARAAFGRCVRQTGKRLRAEREAAEDAAEEAAEEEETLAFEEEEAEAEELDDEAFDDHAPDIDLPHDGKHGDDDETGGKHTLDEDGDEADDPDVGLGDSPDLD